MNRGLILKALRELRAPTLLFASVLFLVEGVLAYALPMFQRQLAQQWLQMPFVQNLLKAMFGVDAAEGLGPDAFASIGWVHPVILALLSAHALVCCTRTPAGEIDRGTIDALLALPVTRWGLYRADSAVCALAGLTVAAATLAGNFAGGSFVPADLRAPASRTLPVALNLLCLYAAIGGLAWLASAMSDRRGRAITAVVFLVLASFLLNYLAQLWDPARRIAFLSPLHYYRPASILRDGAWPLRDMTALAALAAAAWGAGGVVFARRDLSTL